MKSTINIIRLVFTSLIIIQIGLSQNDIQEPELLISPPLYFPEELREPEPDLFYEWEGDPRWLTGVNWGGETFFGGIGRGSSFFGSNLDDNEYVDVKIIFESTDTTWSQIYRRDMGYDAMGPGIFLGSAWDISDEENPRRLNICISEWDDGSGEHPPNMMYDPDGTYLGRREYFFIMKSDYDGSGTTYDDDNWGPSADVLYGGWLKLYNEHSFLEADPSELFLRLAHIRNFQAVSGDQTIDLSWDFEEPDLQYFNLYFGDETENMEVIAEIGPEESSFFHSGLINNVKYYYRMEGITSDGNSSYQSETIHGIPHPVSVNVNFVGGLDPHSKYGDIWGYTHPETGVEYALLCARDDGLSIIDITNEPMEVGFVSSTVPGNDAKDVKVYDHYAVLIMEYEPGLVIDLHDPSNPQVISTIHFGNDGSDGGAHNCYMDGPILYIIGHEGGGVEIYDLSVPENPQFKSHFATYYYHDIYVKDGLGYAAGIYGDGVDILDLSDLENPQFLANFNYPASGAHNTWTTEDGNYVIVGDEIGGGPWTRIFDIQDLSNINMVSEYIVDENAVVHNSYVKGDLLYVAHYTEGVRIVNISDPVNPQEVGYYDTFLPNDYGYLGCWSVYPFFESGKIIASDMQSGLFVLTYEAGMSAEYSQGWNMVGLPTVVEDSHYLSVFPDAVEGTLFNYGWEYYEPPSELIHGDGYWLRFENGGTTFFSGDPLQELTISLNQGWNIFSGIGYSVGESSISDLNGIIIPGTIYGFNETYINTESIEPGYGYWLRSSGDGEITLSSSAPLTKSRQFQSPEYLNTVTLNNTTLYFGKDIPEKDVLSYSLPPKPPVPAMDIRFSGDTKLCTTDECVLEVMNNGKPLTFEFKIKDGESWEIVDESGNVFECSSVNVFELNRDLETLVLRKSTSSKVPTEFALYPVHPNPFNPVTTIRFSIPDVETLHATSLRIYDITGKLVETLVDEKLSPGNQSVQWNAKGFSSGVYFVLLEGSGLREIQKVVLMK